MKKLLLMLAFLLTISATGLAELTISDKDALDKIVRVYMLKPPIIIDGKMVEITEEQYNTALFGTEEEKLELISLFNAVVGTH